MILDLIVKTVIEVLTNGANVDALLVHTLSASHFFAQEPSVTDDDLHLIQIVPSI